MNAKWYVSTLLLLLILFGAFQDQIVVPNQEIVLKFVDAKIDKNNIELTIADIKEKLLNLDVSNILIKETKNGTLKISYYSVVDVKNVKEALVQDIKFVLNKNSKKKQKNNTPSNYDIHVYELADLIDVSNSEDKFIYEIKHHSDRFSADNYPLYLKKGAVYSTDQLFKVSFNVNKNSPFTKDRTSYKEPEVRAGPHIYIL